jgi:formylglycine-generating enzyme required for sulfatase activity
MKKHTVRGLPPSMASLVKGTFGLDKRPVTNNKWLDFILHFNNGSTNKEKLDEFYRLLSEESQK